jgi:hypothetical protein
VQKRRKTGSRTVLTAVIGLALAAVVAASGGISALTRTESGGFMCGYGDCYFYYWDCESAQWQDIGGGNCIVTLSGEAGCTWERNCNGGFFGWVGLQEREWRTQWIYR